MAENSLLHPVDEVRFGTYDPEHVSEALTITRAQAKERYDALVAVPLTERNFANTVLAFTRASEEFDAVVGLAHHFGSVLPGWNEAESEAAAVAAELGNEIAFSTELYSALRDFRDAAAEGLPANERRLLTELVDRYERNGVGLPEAEQQQLRGIRQRYSELQTTFKTNAVEAYNRAGIAVADADELAGLPESFVERCRAAAEERGESGYWVAYTQPTYSELMAGCSHAPTRQAMYEVHISIAGDTNGDVAAEILSLRRRMAELLGFADFSDLATVERMAGSGQRAADFLADLEERYRPSAEAENRDLEEYARELEGDPTLRLTAADVDTGLNFYYATKQYGDRVGFDPQTLREYLPLPQVLDETFALLTTLYGVSFREVETAVWHDDVTAYEVRDERGRHLATMYADWIARPDKRAGAWHNGHYMPPRGAADNGKPFLGYVVFNFPPAEPGEPVLCTPRDAETVLHEVGHFMHNALSVVPLPEQAGTTCKWDFVEAPSQIMENWFWEPLVLNRMARHWRTGEGLPEETVQRLLAARTFRVGAAAMRQLGLATVDLELHRSYAGGDVYEFARTVKQRFLTVPVSPLDQQIATFQHIFAGGYAAGYYSYKWAELIEAALFDRFAREGVLSPEVGRAYARDVLSRGSELEPDELVEAFLGGPATAEPMLRRDGLVGADA